jgi:hypothetical protein
MMVTLSDVAGDVLVRRPFAIRKEERSLPACDGCACRQHARTSVVPRTG